MSYGMQVFNSDGRKVFDTDEGYANTQIASVATSAYTSMTYPPAGYTVGDLILARPVISPVYETGGYIPIAEGNFYGGSDRFYGASNSHSSGFQNTTGIVQGLGKKHTTLATASSGDYGLEVMDSSGAILFSNRATGLKLLATGSISLGTEATYTPPASLNFNKIYAVVNGTKHNYAPGVPLFNIPSFQMTVGYWFYPALSTPKIVIQNKFLRNGTNWLFGPGVFTYMLMYDPN